MLITSINVDNMHTMYYNSIMEIFDWNDKKNKQLKLERGVTFEDVVYHLTHGGLLDAIEHPNQKRYLGQKIFVVNIEEYVYIIPFVEDDKFIFLKTIIPSRKMTKLYLRGNSK